MSARFVKHDRRFDDDKDTRDIYDITLTRGTRSYTFNFGQSVAESSRTAAKRKAPTAYDVLACIQKYDPGSFENFCGDFGYDTDSRKAEKTYRTVREEYLQVSRLFSDAELIELQEIN